MFEPIQTIGDLLGGINSKQRPTKIKDNQSVEIVGFDLDANSVRRAKGYTKLGYESDSNLIGKNLYKHVVSGKTEVLVKTIGAYLKYYDNYSGNWYKATLKTFTENLKWCFKSFNGYLYGVNGVDGWAFWDGSSRSSLTGDITPASITIPITANTNGLFLTTGGKLMIEDDEILYTGILTYSGKLAINQIPVDADYFNYNGVPVRFKNALTVAGDVLIEATLVDTLNNLIDLLQNPGSTTAKHLAFSAPDQITIGNITSTLSVYTISSATNDLSQLTASAFFTNTTKNFYTATMQDILTGVTGIDSNHSSGATVITELDGTTYVGGMELVNRIEIYKNRMYAISALNGAKIIWSKLAGNSTPETDLLDFSVTAGSGSGGFDFAQSQLLALATFVNGANNSILVTFDRNGEQSSFVVTDTDTLTLDSFVPAHRSDTYPVQPHLVAQTENQLVYVDQYGHVQSLQYGNINSPLIQTDISFFIHPSVEATLFTNGYLGYYNRKFYSGGSSSNSGINDITYYNDFNYSAWGAYNHWDVVELAIYNGSLVGLSQVTGNVFVLHNGYSVYVDDPDNANQGSYGSEWVSKEWDFKKPLCYKQALKGRMYGIISTNCQAYVDVFFDGVKEFTFLIDSNNKNILQLAPNVAVGTIVFGQGVEGGGLPGGSVRKEFWCQFAMTTFKLFLKAQFRVRMSGLNVDFEMIDGFLWAKQESDELWLPNQIIIPS